MHQSASISQRYVVRETRPKDSGPMRQLMHFSPQRDVVMHCRAGFGSADYTRRPPREAGGSLESSLV